MAECVQVILPAEMTPLINELREVRAAECESTTNKQIVADAVKEYYKNRVKK